jgi:hypothetical protein
MYNKCKDPTRYVDIFTGCLLHYVQTLPETVAVTSHLIMLPRNEINISSQVFGSARIKDFFLLEKSAKLSLPYVDNSVGKT